jgi:putative sterol carrier protein
VLRYILSVLMVAAVLAEAREDSLPKFRSLTERRKKNDLGHTFQRMAEFLGGTEERGWVQFRIRNGEERRYWCLELGPEGAKAHSKRTTSPDFEVVTPAGTWWQIAEGSISPLEALGQGKMRIRGDVRLGRLILRRLASQEGSLVDMC